MWQGAAVVATQGGDPGRTAPRGLPPRRREVQRSPSSAASAELERGTSAQQHITDQGTERGADDAGELEESSRITQQMASSLLCRK